MVALSAKAMRLLASLREHAEGCEERRHGHTWRNVYLDNARPKDMTPRQFAWHLSALSHAGFYRPIDHDAFGDVRMD